MINKEVSRIIQSRHSVYPLDFNGCEIEDDIVLQILKNANHAPTHRLTQPWRFTVFMEQGLRDFGQFHAELYKANAPTDAFSQMKYDKILNRAKLSSAIIVVGVKKDPFNKVPFLEEIAATSAAVQNMALMATAYGLAFYWGTGGMTFSEEMKLHVGLEAEDQVLGQLFLGYPAGEWPRKTPRKPMEYFTDWRID